MRKFANSGFIEARQREEVLEAERAKVRAAEFEKVRERLKPAGAVVNPELSARYVQQWRDVHVRRKAS